MGFLVRLAHRRRGEVAWSGRGCPCCTNQERLVQQQRSTAAAIGGAVPCGMRRPPASCEQCTSRQCISAPQQQRQQQ